MNFRLKILTAILTVDVDRKRSKIKETGGKSLRRGRLRFYPAFFNKIGLDVINPHDRKTKSKLKKHVDEDLKLTAEAVKNLAASQSYTINIAKMLRMVHKNEN